MLHVEPGGEYRGETYIWCDAHVTIGYNNGPARGDIFEGSHSDELHGFLREHADCLPANG